MTKGSALVTGASAGLGTLFTEELAKQGHDLILTARRTDRLDALADRIRERHGVAVEVIAADLAVPGAAGELADAIAERGLTVALLVNNAGFGAAGDFVRLERDQAARMIELNCRALVELCHAVLPAMLERRGGGILNIASTAAFQPGPGMAIYYATKAFVLSFSEALHEEVRASGVHVSALCPGPTRTEFFDAAEMGGMLLTRFAGPPEKVVRDGLRALAANRAVKVSGLANALMAGSIRFTPRWVVRRLVAAIQRRG